MLEGLKNGRITLADAWKAFRSGKMTDAQLQTVQVMISYTKSRYDTTFYLLNQHVYSQPYTYRRS